MLRGLARPLPLAVGGVLLACLVMRLLVVLTGAGRLDADEAVTGVMAQRILGGDMFVFYAGQEYMGTVEQYAQAVVLALTPDTVGWLRAVPVLLAVVACGLVYMVARRVLSSPWGAVLAAAIFAVGPYYNLLKGTRSHGAYALAVVLCLLGVLVALHFDARSRRAPWLAFAFGVICGLAAWESLLTAYVLVPAALWVIASARGHLRSLLPLGLGGAVLGALPLIAARLSDGQVMGGGESPQPPSTIAERLDGLLDPVAGMFLGVVRAGGGEQPVTRWLAPMVVVVAGLLLLGAAMWTRRRGLWDLATLRTGHRAPIDLVIAAFPVAAVLYALSDYTWFVGEPRYLFTLYPLLAIALAAAVLRTRRAAPALAVVLLCGLLGLSAIQIRDAIRADGYPPSSGGGVIYTEDAPAMADAIADLGVSAVYADYWLAYPLQFAAGDRFAVAALAVDRFPELEDRVARAAAPAFVAPLGVGSDRTAAALTSLGVSHRTHRVGRMMLFYDLSRPVTRDEAIAAGVCSLANCG